MFDLKPNDRTSVPMMRARFRLCLDKRSGNIDRMIAPMPDWSVFKRDLDQVDHDLIGIIESCFQRIEDTTVYAEELLTEYKDLLQQFQKLQIEHDKLKEGFKYDIAS